jgi:hypothetical protein
VDHIQPLSEGGNDDPSNMQLLTKEDHLQKTLQERSARSETYEAPNIDFNFPPVFQSSDYFSPACGAPTRSGGFCTRKVKGGGYCFQHR